MITNNLKITYEQVSVLKSSEFNPRSWSREAIAQLKESIEKYGFVDPLLVNCAPGREGIVIGGHFRLLIAKELCVTTVPVVYLTIPDIEKEKELNIRLNKNTGDWDWNLLKGLEENFLSDIGFSSEELDTLFALDEVPEVFDLQKELQKLHIEQVEVRKQDVWQLGPHRLMCGDSTIEADVTALMNGEKADLCLTDPPYILDYLKGKKKNGEATAGFGYKRDRRYLETDTLPPDFTELWMKNISSIAKPDFSIIGPDPKSCTLTLYN